MCFFIFAAKETVRAKALRRKENFNAEEAELIAESRNVLKPEAQCHQSPYCPPDEPAAVRAKPLRRKVADY
ncbi:MAG: hypothetical protein IT279_02915 [Ignavibacteriaceae bacterium]|nr:hypothetical protein [Ignavibacteriaceae bacterium]